MAVNDAYCLLKMIFEVVTVADAEDHAGNSFLIGFLIGELTFGHKARFRS